MFVCDWPDVQRGRGRSPFDLIMNQIRRKRTTSDRKSTSGRFLSRQAESGGLPEDREAEEERDGAGERTVRTSISSKSI